MKARRAPTHEAADFPWSRSAEIERMIEARVALRAEAQAWRWRLRLILIETMMLAGLMLVSGLLIHQPAPRVLRAAALVGAGCLASGLMLIGLSALTGRLLAGIRHWRAR